MEAGWLREKKDKENLMANLPTLGMFRPKCCLKELNLCFQKLPKVSGNLHTQSVVPAAVIQKYS